MTESERHRRAPGWVWRRWGGSVLVVGPDRVAHQLDAAAAAVWLHLDRPRAVAELRAVIPTPPDRPLGDDRLPSIEDAILELSRRAMVVPADSAAHPT